MKNTFGNAVTVTLFGESHGKAVGAVIDGLSPGIPIDEEYIREKMNLRKAYGKISTARQEEDEVKFISGVFQGHSTGTPLTLLIENQNTKSEDYGSRMHLPRPSHADYTGHCKYGGYEDYRGGGHFSGRITAALVAAGALTAKALEDKGIYIGTHILNCHGVCDRHFDGKAAIDDIKKLAGVRFRCWMKNLRKSCGLKSNAPRQMATAWAESWKLRLSDFRKASESLGLTPWKECSRMLFFRFPPLKELNSAWDLIL